WRLIRSYRPRHARVRRSRVHENGDGRHSTASSIHANGHRCSAAHLNKSFHVALRRPETTKTRHVVTNYGARSDELWCFNNKCNHGFGKPPAGARWDPKGRNSPAAERHLSLARLFKAGRAVR